jgi:hypothetical protein
MQERRSEPRLLCADLVEVHWQDKSGRARRAVANLEDISLSGACLQLENAIPLKSRVRISHGGGQFEGEIMYCVYREIGYFLGVKFDSDTRWSRKDFKPQHLFDPRRLADDQAAENEQL